MFKSSFIAAISAALALAGVTAMPAQARATGATATTMAAAPAPQGRTASPNARGQRRAAPPTPEQSIAAAQTIATSASVACQVTQANPLGLTAEQAPMFEAACATGPGYILVGSTPPQAIDCVLLAGQAAIERARDPAAAAGVQCVIPQNADVMRVIAAYATEAGIPCTVNEGASIGKSSAGNPVYEIGCNGVDGYWLEREPTGWLKTECGTIITQGGACRFSTAAEQVSTLKARIASNAEAAACDVSESRYMGANANGAFYEAKCAGGNGVIVRFDNAFAVQQVYACENARRVGGGCTLTVVPAPEETPAAPTTQQ